ARLKDLVTSVQAIEGQLCDLRLADPGRLELGTERHDQQYRQVADVLDGKVEHLAGRGVDPMHILEDHNYRLQAGQTFEVSKQRPKCLFLLALWAEAWQRVALRSRQ